MIPAFEHYEGPLWELFAFAAAGGAVALYALIRRSRRPGGESLVWPSLILFVCVSAFIFLPEDWSLIKGFFGGAVAVGLAWTALRWKKPQGGGAAARDLEKMFRWDKDAGKAPGAGRRKKNGGSKR